MNRVGIALILGMLITTSALATSNAKVINKSNYTIFTPTPSQHLRELSTDRPDKTEGPYIITPIN